MILKELDNWTDERNKRRNNGRETEEKMAFYLRVEFREEAEINVINGLRINPQDESGFIQIDHLVIHPYGFVLIEDKTVKGKIQKAEDGQWKHWYNDKATAIPNPIKQVEIQAKRLKSFFHRKYQGDFFQDILFDTIVAISDGGEILPVKKGAPHKNLMVAHQVTDKIRDKLNVLTKREPNQHLSPIHIKAIWRQIGKMHTPYEKDSTENVTA